MVIANLVQTLDEAVCIWHIANTIVKGMKPCFNYSDSIYECDSKVVWNPLESLTLLCQLIDEKENSEYKTVKHR